MLKNVLIYVITSIVGVSYAQNGLKGVFVERFYSFSKKDMQKSNITGVKEKGLVTYRIYVELDSGYTLQAVYGMPTHPLRFTSSKTFYNHPGIGNSHPNVIPDKSLKKNLTILDSWITIGACSESFFAVPLKYYSQPLAVVIDWEKGFFENMHDRDINMSFRDAPGMIYIGSDSLPQLTLYQIDTPLKGLLAESNQNEILIENGAWACMGKGASAPKPYENTILIAQLTTAGKLTYSLNLQIGTPDGKSIRFVASDPNAEELTHPTLTQKNLK
jgi:hypothetical protein